VRPTRSTGPTNSHIPVGRSSVRSLTEPVLQGLGAYLIVQRHTGGRQLGSVSETDGRDAPGNYSAPASPNGALTAITYNYAGKLCVDDGRLRLTSCGLSEVRPHARLGCRMCTSPCEFTCRSTAM
jgi:hypothetical protein